MPDGSPPDPVNAPARHRLATDTENGVLLIISGPSGAGKTTITRAVERSIPGSVFSVSATTRPKTDADVEGVDYHFVSEEEFVRMIDADEFLEHVRLFDKRYGTPRRWVQEQLARGRLVILEIDVVGAIKVKSQIPEALGLFIMPPSEDVLLQRLRSRRRESEDVIQRRFAEAKREIAQSRATVDTPRGPVPVYDVFIVNDDLDRAIAEAARAVRERYPGEAAVDGVGQKQNPPGGPGGSVW